MNHTKKNYFSNKINEQTRDLTGPYNGNSQIYKAVILATKCITIPRQLLRNNKYRFTIIHQKDAMITSLHDLSLRYDTSSLLLLQETDKDNTTKGKKRGGGGV